MGCWLPSIAALNDMGQNILRIRTATLRLIVIREPSALAQNTALLNQLKGDLRQAQARYESLRDAVVALLDDDASLERLARSSAVAA